MCTGFFLFEPRPILALNFDFERTFSLTLENDLTFCMRIRFGDSYGLPLGVNKNGRSANVQLAPLLEAGCGGPDRQDVLQLHHLVHRILLENMDVRSLPSLIREHGFIYSSQEIGSHCLFADRDGNLCIADPGSGCITNDAFPDGFAVLTNFTLAKHLPLSSNTDAIPCKRYKKAYAMLLENRTGTDRLMEILEAVKQTKGRLPTIFSMVAELDTGKICFTLDGDFSKRYHFSFADNCICAGEGHQTPHRILLDPAGIAAAELRAWD